MAEAKKKPAAKKGVDPFKTKKTRTLAAKVNDTVTPPADVAEAIDEFRAAQEQAKHFEGEATVHKDKILAFSHGEYARRLLNGVNSSFKILGDETMVTYVVTDGSAGLTEEDVEALSERWGEEAAEALVTRDFQSIRFDAKVLEANYDEVVEALQTLRPEVLDSLFKPMLMKATPGAAETAKRFAKKPDELKELLTDLKIKNYVK